MLSRFFVGIMLLFFTVQSEANWFTDIFHRYNAIDEYGRTLKDHEGRFSRNGDNGHTLSRHVYYYYSNDSYRLLTLNDLRKRCRSDFHQAFGGGATFDVYKSKFNSYREAKYTAKEMIKDNRIGITQFQLANVSGASPSNIYSIDKGRVVYSYGFDYWLNNAINCNVSVLGKRRGHWFWRHYKDEKIFRNARMVIKFNKNKNLMRWFISSLYPDM